MQIHSCFPLGAQIIDNKQRFVTYKNSDARKKFLYALVGASLDKGLTPVLIVGQDSDGSKMAELSLFTDMNHASFSDVDLASAKSLKKRYHHSTSQVLEQVVNRNKDIFGRLKISDVIEHYLDSHGKQEAQILLHELDSKLFDFNKTEYWKIAGRIRTATGLYDPQYQYYHKHNTFNDTIFINKEGEFSTSILLKYLTNFQTKCQILLSGFSELFSELKKIEIAKVSAINQQLQTKIQEYLVDLNLSSSDKLGKSDLKKWQKVVDELILAQEDHRVKTSKKSQITLRDKADIITALEDLQLAVKKQFRSVEHDATEFLKSINVRSISNSRLEQIEKELRQLVKSINDSDIFAEKIENNAISSLKQFQHLKSIFSQLLSAQHQIIKMGSYYDWKAFLASQNKQVKSIIESLHTVPASEWESTFESYYLFKIIEKNLAVRSTSFQESLSNYISDTIEVEDNLESLLIESIQRRKEAKNLDPVQLTNFYDVDFSQSNAFYIFLENPSKKLSSPELPEQYCLLCDVRTVDLVNSPLDNGYVNKKLAVASIDDKLDQARFLATWLTFDNANLHLYLTKNSNVILHCSTWKQERILQQLPSKSLKTVRAKENQEQGITEYFLNDSSELYYLYDNLFDDIDNANGMASRVQFLLALQNAGYKTIWIDSAELIEDPFHLEDIIGNLEINI